MGIPFVFAPITAIAAERQLPGSVAVSGPAAQATPPGLMGNVQEPLPPPVVTDLKQFTGSFQVPEKQNLAALIGKSEIAVLADAGGDFLRSLVENGISEDAPASQVEGTTLLDSISAGRTFSRESLAALARTGQARSQTGQAFALLLPSLSLHANYGGEHSEPSVAIDDTGHAKGSDTHSRADYGLSLRQPLFDLPTFLDWRRRQVLEQARDDNYRSSDGDAYLAAVNAYLTLVSDRLQVDVTRDFEAQLEKLYIYIEKRANAGASSFADMARVRARRESTLSSRLEQESALAAAGIDFIRITNVAPRKARLPELNDIGAALLPDSFRAAASAAMTQNPEIAALAAELRAAAIDVSAAKGRFLPRLSAEFTDTYSLHAGGASSGQRDQRLMMVVDWNLFNGGGDYRTVEERRARQDELRYRLDDQRRRVVQTLSANYATLAATTERINSGYQELKSISLAAEAMSKRMLSGNQSLLDLLDVYDRFYQARSRLITLHVLEMTTVAQLVRLTMGVPWGAPPAAKAFSRPATVGGTGASQLPAQ